MSLRHSLLAILTAKPMTGYELMGYFDDSVAFLWSAPHSQIYPELRRMEAQGMVTAEVVPRGERAEKRVYTISDEGHAELSRWANDIAAAPPERDAFRLKASYFEFATRSTARRQLQAHLNVWSRRLDEWQQLVEEIAARRVPLLQRRLETRPPSEHETIVAFKIFAYQGQIARAQAEVDWAQRGIALLDGLPPDEDGVPPGGGLGR